MSSYPPALNGNDLRLFLSFLDIILDAMLPPTQRLPGPVVAHTYEPTYMYVEMDGWDKDECSCRYGPMMAIVGKTPNVMCSSVGMTPCLFQIHAQPM